MTSIPTRPLPSLERIREKLDYNPVTGDLRWKKTGEPAGTLEKVRLRVTLNGQRYPATRLAWKLATGEDAPEPLRIVHIDGNKFNLRFSNLRLVSHSKATHHGSRKRVNRTGYKGVCRIRDRYFAEITENGKRTRLGGYSTPQEAHQAYCRAAREAYGDLAVAG